MDKPTTLTVKDWIIRNMSTDLMIKEKTLQAIINHQFSRAREAMETGKVIEFSGFGRFNFNVKRAYIKLFKFYHIREGLTITINKPETSAKKRGFCQYKLGILAGDIKLLENKLGNHEAEYTANCRRLAESYSASREEKRNNSEGKQE